MSRFYPGQKLASASERIDAVCSVESLLLGSCLSPTPGSPGRLSLTVSLPPFSGWAYDLASLVYT